MAALLLWQSKPLSPALQTDQRLITPLRAGNRAPNPWRSRCSSKQQTGQSLQAWPNSRNKILLSPWAHHGQDRSRREAIARHDPGQPSITEPKSGNKDNGALAKPTNQLPQAKGRNQSKNYPPRGRIGQASQPKGTMCSQPHAS